MATRKAHPNIVELSKYRQKERRLVWLKTRILKVYLSVRCIVLFDDGEHFHPPGCVESESKKDDGNHD